MTPRKHELEQLVSLLISQVTDFLQVRASDPEPIVNQDSGNRVEDIKAVWHQFVSKAQIAMAETRPETERIMESIVETGAKIAVITDDPNVTEPSRKLVDSITARLDLIKKATDLVGGAGTLGGAIAFFFAGAVLGNQATQQLAEIEEALAALTDWSLRRLSEGDAA